MSLYGEYAREYAAHTAVSFYNVRYERPAMQKRLGSLRGKQVLDAGCASGEFAAYMLDAGAQVVCVDNSPAMLGLARERTDDRAKFILADLAKPLADVAAHSFDLVLSSLTMHYLEDWSVPLSEFRRMLRPGGRFLMSTHHPVMTLGQVQNYFEVTRITETWRIGSEEREVTFYHRPLEAIINAVADAGFRLEAVVEPHLEDDARDVPPNAERLRTQPWFLILDAIAE